MRFLSRIQKGSLLTPPSEKIRPKYTKLWLCCLCHLHLTCCQVHSLQGIQRHLGKCRQSIFKRKTEEVNSSSLKHECYKYQRLMTSNCRSISTWASPFWVTGWLSTIMCYAISDTHQPLLSILKGYIPFRYFALLSKSHLQPESHFPCSTKVVAAPVVLSVLTFLSQALKLTATACLYMSTYLFIFYHF